MRSPQRILYQQHCAECARSYTYRHNFKREPTHACACMYDYMQSSEHALVQWRRAQGRAIIARSRARTRSPISSSSIELLYMKMRDNIPANWRTCMGALQTRARAKKDPQEGRKRPRDTSTVRADISSETKVRTAQLCKPLRLGCIYPSPMLVRVRDSAIADDTPPTIHTLGERRIFHCAAPDSGKYDHGAALGAADRLQGAVPDARGQVGSGAAPWGSL